MSSDYEARLLAAEAQVNRAGQRLASDEAREAALENAAWLTRGRSGKLLADVRCLFAVTNANTGLLIAATCQARNRFGVIVGTTTTPANGVITLTFQIPPWESGQVYSLEASAAGLNPSPAVKHGEVGWDSIGGWDMSIPGFFLY